MPPASCDPADPHACAARRRAEGKSGRGIRRCLMRYVARQFYRALATAMTTTPSYQPPSAP